MFALNVCLYNRTKYSITYTGGIPSTLQISNKNDKDLLLTKLHNPICLLFFVISSKLTKQRKQKRRNDGNKNNIKNNKNNIRSPDSQTACYLIINK